VDGFPSLWNQVARLKESWPKLKITLSVGGAGDTVTKNLAAMAAVPGKRAIFIADVCTWMKDKNLDGVDIDWESPRGTAQWKDYISLLGELRTALDNLEVETGKAYSLSSAVGAGYSEYSADLGAGGSAAYNAFMLQAAAMVTSLKVMHYDYYGNWWPNLTGHNASLYHNPSDPNPTNTDTSITDYLNAGIPPEKLMLGAAFYGKAWDGVSQGITGNMPGLFRPYKAYGGDLSWTSIKRNYLRAGSGYIRYWDNFAKAPFLYNKKRWITYSDTEQMKCLADYAKEKHLGGVFAWEYMQDTNGELLKVLAENSR
jgi:chitinase